MKIIIKAKNSKGEKALMKHIEDRNNFNLVEKLQSKILYSEKCINLKPYTIQVTINAPGFNALIKSNRVILDVAIKTAKEQMDIELLKFGATKKDYSFEVI